MNPKRLEGMDRSKEVVHISDTEQLTLQVNGGKVDENHSRILQNLITRKKKKKKKVKKKGKKCRGLKKAGKGGKGKKKKKGKYSKYKDDLCFDIQMCNTYSDIWTIDLGLTCRDGLDDIDETDRDEYRRRGCSCDTAEELIENGEIDCDTFSCPEDCTVCQTCLSYVVRGCYDKFDRFPRPSNGQPSPPSNGRPSPDGRPPSGPPPTNDRPSPPTNGGPPPPPPGESRPSPPPPPPNGRPGPSPPPPSPQIEPRSNFNINQCESYQNLWGQELGTTCTGNIFSQDYSGCRCDDAQKRINNNEITCNGRSPCPSNCFACSICLENVIDDCRNQLNL
jgi:hypothetical protein